ncbi:MAG: DUF1684 domain-containing protein [Thaumarchaeota archaeon]|nr:DUF1684 domain-containing protein [Nitrososphaerota archaeon]
MKQPDWKRELDEFRKEKDSFYASGHESPITEQERGSFKGLKYFPPDPGYAIKTKLHRYLEQETVVMTTSKGTKQRFHKVGYFELEFNGQKVWLQAYKTAEREDNHLFIPFRDETSGKESYSAARYLDLEISTTDEYTIDFNLAYNPYCAYNDGYVCPLPPRENWLGVEIRAGEKSYH